MTPRPRNLDPSDLVSHAEIANRLGVEIDTVHKWKQRYTDFPEPFVVLRIGPVYWMPDVQAWHSGRVDTSETSESADSVAKDRSVG